LIALLLAVLACGPFPDDEAPTLEFPTPNLIGTAVAGTQLALDGQPTGTPTQAPVPPTDTPVLPTETPTEPAPEPSPTGLRRAGGDFTANFLNQAPNIDGNLDEWSLPEIAVNHVVYGEASYAGPDDVSGSVMIGWNANMLFIGLRVRDNRYVQNATGNQIFRGDFFEVILDTDLEGDFNIDSLSSDDYQLGMTLGSSPNGNSPRNYLWFPFNKEGELNSITIRGHSTTAGYEAEAAIPWSVFGIAPQPGDLFGFSFAISDNDVVDDNVQEVMVSIVPTRLLVDPTTWGNLLLAGP